MKIYRNGMEIKLTADEIYNAYLEQEYIFRREDAERQMRWHLGIGEDEPFNYTDKEVDEVINLFDKYMDCDSDENSTWEFAIDKWKSEKYGREVPQIVIGRYKDEEDEE